MYRARAGGNKGRLVFLHGGGFLFGDKYPLNSGGNIRRQLRRGYSVVSVNYRMPDAVRDEAGQPVVEPSPGTGWPLPQNASGNGFPDAMAGGTMAVLAGTTADSAEPAFSGMPRVDGWVAISPLVDWDGFADGERWGRVWMGDEFDQHRDVTTLANHLDRADPRGYIVHGVSDTVVPVASVQRFRDRLRGADGIAYLRVSLDLVDRLADGRAMQESAIGQPDPRGHNPVGGMNADWFDRWLDAR